MLFLISERLFEEYEYQFQLLISVGSRAQASTIVSLLVLICIYILSSCVACQVSFKCIILSVRLSTSILQGALASDNPKLYNSLSVAFIARPVCTYRPVALFSRTRVIHHFISLVAILCPLLSPATKWFETSNGFLESRFTAMYPISLSQYSQKPKASCCQVVAFGLMKRG